MAADTTMTIYGAGHLAGQTARLVICGINAGTYTVAQDGSVVFTFGGDPGGILTVDYIIDNPSIGSDHDVTFQVYDGTAYQTVTIPVLIGIDFTRKGQLIRPLAEAAMQSGPGAGLGKTRRAVWGAVLVRDLFGLEIGTDFTNMYTATVTTDGGLSPELAIAADAPYTGVLLQQLDDQTGFDSQLAWRSSLPYSVVIGGASLFFEGAPR